jgi:hypothetical protein
MAPIRRIIIKREVLLFEIERRCSFAECNQRVFMGLTKQEAQDYNGYECTFCERWNQDALKRTDIPDWWEEVQSNQPTSH